MKAINKSARKSIFALHCTGFGRIRIQTFPSVSIMKWYNSVVSHHIQQKNALCQLNNRTVQPKHGTIIP